MKGLLALLLLTLAATVAAVPTTSLMDPDLHNAAVTSSIWDFYSHYEGLYGVVYHAKVVTADTLEFVCVNGAGVTNRLVSCRLGLMDTLPALTTSVPIEVLIYRNSTYDSTGTALTEFRMDQAEAGTITSAWYVNPVDANGTLVAAYWAKSNEWFTLPTYLENTATYMIGVVLAAKKYVSFEAIWTEEE